MKRLSMRSIRAGIATVIALGSFALVSFVAIAGAGASTTAKAIAGTVDVNTVLGNEDASAAGTGMVLTSGGEVLTNNHVIRDATSIKVRDVKSGKSYTATVVGYDIAADIAVLQLKNATGLKTVPIGDSSSVKVGAKVIGIGNAGGAGGTPRSANGTVTALDQTITASDEFAGTSEQLSGLIETNAALEPGDSGGPLVNGSGAVIGVDTAASSSFQFQSGASEGFAIPINAALAIAAQIEAANFSGDVHRGATSFLGVEVGNSNYFQYGSLLAGALVFGVVPSSPADKAGLNHGDVITALNGRSVTSPTTLVNALLAIPPGTKVSLRWVDQFGASHKATVKLASGPPQ